MDALYDSGAPGRKGSIYGLPYTPEEASCVIIPIPWDVTASYGQGASLAPKAILDASVQLDLEIPGLERPWKMGLAMTAISPEIERKSKQLRKKVEPYIQALENDALGEALNRFANVVDSVNDGTENLREEIYKETQHWIKEGKLVGLLGGDHSCPLGFINALSEVHDEFGILQVDAHMDLRDSYEGFKHSHASIMHNVLQSDCVKKLVQVGIRDYCLDEQEAAKSSNIIDVFYDQFLKERQFNGEYWGAICHDIVEKLPQKVYISFDIDGLDPKLCSGTGTPVPGGLSYPEAMFLIKEVVQSGRKIIGFDLCEVAPKDADNEWNANVGARVLYNLACWAGVSNGMIKQED